ncbi:hypothetical protein JCM33374_g481 [Metschnikowia sp. JCM 33374]|nr:hypothetical protein JCM33374_g481 [Metschnikowia sp. JCM 33374]
MSPKRPSLFSNSSRYTSDTILSLQRQKCSDEVPLQLSGDESSDISEDESSDGGDYFDYDPTQDTKSVKSSLPQHPEATKHQNIQHGSRPQLENRGNRSSSNNIFRTKDISPRQRNSVSPKNSTNKEGSRGNIFFIPNSPPPHDADNEHVVHLSRNAPSGLPISVQRKDSLFTNKATITAGSADHVASSLSSTDISEVSDFEDHPSSLHDIDVNQVIADARSQHSERSAKSVDDTDSEWMSVSSESDMGPDSPITQPISFAKRMPIPQTASEISSISPPADDTLRSSPSSFKPRSLLSGLFLNEMSNSSIRSPVSTKSSKLEHSAPKPVLKRSSTTGVITVDSGNNARGLQRPSILLSKRYASSSDFTKKVAPHRSPILYIAEEDTIKEDLSKSGERNLFAKQTSSVGLSNFLATADGKNVSQTGDAKRGSSLVDQDASVHGADILLSSSLTKYATLKRESSFKNIFSKSSINISSLLGHGLSGKLRLHSDNRSCETVKSMPQQEVGNALPPMASSFAEHLSQQSLMESSKSESTTTTTKSVRVEPASLKDFTPSVQISESLKHSLMIDHKLGKAPLPERIISNDDLFSGHDKELFVHESSDYHSKGW